MIEESNSKPSAPINASIKLINSVDLKIEDIDDELKWHKLFTNPIINILALTMLAITLSVLGLLVYQNSRTLEDIAIPIIKSK